MGLVAACRAANLQNEMKQICGHEIKMNYVCGRHARAVFQNKANKKIWEI